MQKRSRKRPADSFRQIARAVVDQTTGAGTPWPAPQKPFYRITVALSRGGWHRVPDLDDPWCRRVAGSRSTSKDSRNQTGSLPVQVETCNGRCAPVIL